MFRTLRKAEYLELITLFFLQGAALGIWFVPLSNVLDAHGLQGIKPYAFACDLRALVARQSLPGYVLSIERMPDNGMELLTFRPVPQTARG